MSSAFTIQGNFPQYTFREGKLSVECLGKERRSVCSG